MKLKTAIIIIIYLYKIAILQHGMQSFRIIVYCTPVYCTLVYCMVVTSRIYPAKAASISLREHANERYVDPDSMVRNELVLKTFDNYQ